MDTERYQALMDAAKILATLRRQQSKEDGDAVSPAWTLLAHATQHCELQATEVFRSDKVSQ